MLSNSMCDGCRATKEVNITTLKASAHFKCKVFDKNVDLGLYEVNDQCALTCVDVEATLKAIDTLRFCHGVATSKKPDHVWWQHGNNDSKQKAVHSRACHRLISHGTYGATCQSCLATRSYKRRILNNVTNSPQPQEQPAQSESVNITCRALITPRP